MERQKFPSWRQAQYTFTKDKIEFLQDQRILDFLTDIPTLTFGDTKYFHDKLNVSELTQYDLGLIIINELTSDRKLEHTLKNLKTKFTDNAKICLSINKFLVYARENNDTINNNYDIALLEFVKNIFPKKQIDHYFIKNVNGNYFNSASPTTQFFIT